MPGNEHRKPKWGIIIYLNHARDEKRNRLPKSEEEDPRRSEDVGEKAFESV